MNDTTKISWTDHTFNPWWGCTKIAPGCDNCYAAALDKRTGGNHWISNQNKKANKPRLTGKQNWAKPLKWNKLAEQEGKRRRVFCGSMMDWCDKNAPEGAIECLWQIIRDTPYLDWQLLTKRASRIHWLLPRDWGEGYDNVWLGVTVEDKLHGLDRIKILSGIPAKVRFLSCEPLLEDLGEIDLDEIHWVIVGGESGAGFRPMDEQWALNLVQHSLLELVPVWFKQWGGNGKNKGGHIIADGVLQQWPLGHKQ